MCECQKGYSLSAALSNLPLKVLTSGWSRSQLHSTKYVRMKTFLLSHLPSYETNAWVILRWKVQARFKSPNSHFQLINFMRWLLYALGPFVRFCALRLCFELLDGAIPCPLIRVKFLPTSTSFLQIMAHCCTEWGILTHYDNASELIQFQMERYLDPVSACSASWQFSKLCAACSAKELVGHIQHKAWEVVQVLQYCA